MLGLGMVAQPARAQDTARVIRGLDFVGNHAIDDYTLSNAIATTNSSWFAREWLVRWLGLGEKRTFDPVEFRRDVLRLTLFYRQSGYMDVRVDTLVRREGRDVYLTFRIAEGQPITVTGLTITGLEGISDRENILQDLPLRVGAPFNRFLFQASADTIISRFRNRGYPAADVFRSFSVDREGRTAADTLQVVPGPQAVFGPIRVTGAKSVDSTFVRQLLSAREGQRYSEQDLFQSQRKLYQTELFRLATVGIDSSRYGPDSTVVPVAVEVAEGPAHRLRSSIGYGTNDCFRGGVGWTDRNLFGTGRLFDISGSVSKVGVGRPLGFGLERSLCKSLQDDTIGSFLANYNVTALVRQPRFFSPDITGTYSIYGERRSEFAIYRREDIGANLSLTRETARRVPITLTYGLSYGATEATPATFCAFFNACTPDDITRIRQRRFLGVVTASVSWPRQNNPVDPSRGHFFTFDASHSSRFTGSASLQTFTRFSGDMAWYRTLGSSGAVLSWRVRGGVILAPQVSLDSSSSNFIPPEDRFYAGGPNDVRGYDLNELGPVVYVVNAISGDTTGQATLAQVDSGKLRPRFSPTGGNTLGVGQVELRVPAPVWGSRLRLAFFVDAGTLYQRGKTNLSPIQLRITPGIGLRLSTPLGPARLDVAYNGYDQPPGALYLQKLDGSLALVRTAFVQPRASRLTYHVSVGEPF
ncbi:MAG TPA: BamA/TamA family outer membrane protein [Gemmatimonadales bacterium]|nr:BamA/TamA family outer membrane protein [Gemmatimonadales bacterium]